MDDWSEAQQKALDDAAEEVGLPTWYRTLVRPLMRDPEGRWPRCCGGGCDPCAMALCDVARLALQKLGTPRKAPLPD